MLPKKHITLIDGFVSHLILSYTKIEISSSDTTFAGHVPAWQYRWVAILKLTFTQIIRQITNTLEEMKEMNFS